MSTENRYTRKRLWEVAYEGESSGGGFNSLLTLLKKLGVWKYSNWAVNSGPEMTWEWIEDVV